MGQEIERKFLVNERALELPAEGREIRQGYIPTEGNTAVRVRISGDRAYLTVKGESRGAVRSEFEYPIPVGDARAMLEELCGGRTVNKIRYEIPLAGHVWEVDIFSGDNEGLCVAEIELRDEGEAFEKPPWLGREVTADPRYYNSSLVETPYKNWRE